MGLSTLFSSRPRFPTGGRHWSAPEATSDHQARSKPLPLTRQELLHELQQMLAEGVDQCEIIEYVYIVAGRYGIRVRHDQYDPHSGPVVLADTVTADTVTAAADTVTAAADTVTAAAVTAAADAAAADTAAADTVTAVVANKAADGKRARRKEKKAAQTIPVTFVRQRNGTHQLAIGGPFDAEDQSTIAPVRGAIVGRLVLSADKRARNGGAARGRDIPLYYECNGLVIDARTWRALAIPPNAFSGRPSARFVDGLLAEGFYDIIRVDDGTVVTLYCWEHPTNGPTWALASSNGYDVSSLCWIGPLTYAAVFHDIIQRLYPEFMVSTGMTLEAQAEGVTRLNFTKLDRTRCYTVGFRHHNFHPMKTDPERMWQIQSTDLSGITPNIIFSGNGRGLPVIPDQHVYADDFLGAPTTLERLRSAGSPAFAQAVAYAAATELPRPRELPTELNYGYILRPRSLAHTRGHLDFLIETPLLEKIREIVYERAPRSIRDKLVATDRLEYNALRAFLTASQRGSFLALYPDWAARFQAYEEFVNNVIHRIVNAIRHRAVDREVTFNSPTGQVAHALLGHICRYEKLTAFHKHVESIVRDYVVNPEYAFLFLRTMHSAHALSGDAVEPKA